MPCTKCENGKYKWGKTGECKYDSKEACEEDNNKNYNKMRPTPLGKTYEQYEKELKEYNLSTQRFDFKDMKSVEKAIAAANSLGDADNIVDGLKKSKSSYDTLGKEYDAISKELKKLNAQQDKIGKPLGKAEDTFNNFNSKGAQLRNKMIAVLNDLEYNRNIFLKAIKNLGIKKNPPVIAEATSKMKQIEKSIKALNKATDLRLK
jgi:hypothetical protein